MAEPVYNILLNCPVDLVESIDSWRQSQPVLPPRNRAIRDLLRAGLQQHGIAVSKPVEVTAAPQ
jgi:uroporphyrinogen-III synthase